MVVIDGGNLLHATESLAYKLFRLLPHESCAHSIAVSVQSVTRTKLTACDQCVRAAPAALKTLGYHK